MSEYQYYEFAAIDRPLTPTEMVKLRAISTRADITPTSFVNHYEWGDLKANPADWMQHYFDAFVYTANWCSCQLSLRVPLDAFPKGALKPFAVRHALAFRATKTHWIIDWWLGEGENHDRFAVDDGSRWMRRLAPLREELMLAAAQLESARVPPGAAERGGRLDSWLKTWSRDQMAAVLKLIIQGKAQTAERRVSARHSAWLKTQRSSRGMPLPRRSVSQLRELAQAASDARPKRKGARK
jgi:hypothetical protein